MKSWSMKTKTKTRVCWLQEGLEWRERQMKGQRREKIQKKDFTMLRFYIDDFRERQKQNIRHDALKETLLAFGRARFLTFGCI